MSFCSFNSKRNQRASIKGVMDKTLSRATLSNHVTIRNMLGAIPPFLTVDEGVELRLCRVARFRTARHCRGDVPFFTMPTLATATVGSQSTVQVDYGELDVSPSTSGGHVE